MRTLLKKAAKAVIKFVLNHIAHPDTHPGVISRCKSVYYIQCSTL